MVFCFGSRRSGTYLLERLLGSQPAVAVIPSETHLISHGIAPLLERFHHGVPSAPRVGVVYGERERLLDAARDFCDVAFGEFDRSGASLLLERTPLHADHGALLGELYPDERFIHIIRDGRDVSASLVAQRWGPGTIAEAAAEWSRSVLGGRELASAPGYHELRYEDLLADPGAELRRLFSALGLDTGEAAIAAAEAELERPLNVGPAAAIGTQKWKTSLSAAELAAFDAEAGSLLRELGYPDSGVGTAPGRSRLRAAGKRVGDLVGGRRTEPASERGDPRFSDPHDTINGLLEAAASEGDIAALLSDDVRVRVVSTAGTRDASGAEGVALLAATLAEDPALHGRQLREELLLSGAPTAVVSLRFELAGGGHAERMIAVTTLRGLGETVLYVAL
jgi:hypothetical protein